MKSSKFLGTILVVDGLLAVGFGAASWLSPYSTFGTIVNLSEAAPTSLTLATLSSLSTFYILIGLVCLLAAGMPYPHNGRIAMVMIVRHVWVGIRGFQQIDHDWLIGDPWPDIIIHGLFTLAYLVALFLAARRTKT